MKIRLMLAASMIAFGAASASAADLGVAHAPAPTGFNWTGLYAGVQGGYQWGSVSGPFQNSTLTGSGPYSFGANSGLFGGFAGYNYQINSFVAGLEGDINASFGGKTTARNVVYSAPTTLYDLTGQQTWNGDIRARLGFAVDRFLPYVTGGVAFGDVKTSYAFAGASPFLTHSTTRAGWTIGLGVEYAITDNIIARIDYRHTDLGQASFTNLPLNTHDNVKFHSDAVLVGISYKFN